VFQGYSNTRLFRSKYFASSGNTYHYGEVGSGTTQVFIMKMDSAEQVGWSNRYQPSDGSIYTFEVTSDENYLFFMSVSNTMLSLYQLNAADGSHSQHLTQSSFSVHNTRTLLGMSPDGSTLFFNVKTATEYQLCRWVINSGTDFHCFSSPTLAEHTTLGFIDSNDLVVVSFSVSNNDFVNVRRISYDSVATTTQWSFEIDLVISYGVNNLVHLDIAGDKSYHLISMDSNKLFMTLSLTDGSVIGNRFKSSETCNKPYSNDIVEYNNKLYMFTNCREPILYEYDMLLQTFAQPKKMEVNSQDVWSMYLKNDRLYFSATKVDTTQS